MGKEKKHLILFFALSLSLFACNDPNAPDLFKSTGRITTQTRLLPTNILQIDVKDNINVELIQDDSSYLEINAGSNLIPSIKTEISPKGALEIYNTNKFNWVRSYKQKISVKIHASNYIHFRILGFGQIFSQDTLLLNQLRIEHYGASEVNLKLQCKKLFYDGNSVGNVNLIGTSDFSEMYIQGFMKLNSSNLENIGLFLEHRGENDIFVNCTTSFNCNIINTGNVYLIGNPEVNLNKSGSGKLIRK